jgi:hypothetical protein
MGVDDFLKASDDVIDAILGTKTMVCNGQTFNVVWNDETKALDGEFGGLEGDIQAVAVAQTDDVTNPKSMLQKRCTVGGVAFRVYQVRTGNVATHFILSDVNQAR